MSSTGTLRSTKYGSVASLDSLRSSDPFSKSPKLSRKQLSMEDIPEGPSKKLNIFFFVLESFIFIPLFHMLFVDHDIIFYF